MQCYNYEVSIVTVTGATVIVILIQVKILGKLYLLLCLVRKNGPG